MNDLWAQIESRIEHLAPSDDPEATRKVVFLLAVALQEWFHGQIGYAVPVDSLVANTIENIVCQLPIALDDSDLNSPGVFSDWCIEMAKNALVIEEEPTDPVTLSLKIAMCSLSDRHRRLIYWRLEKGRFDFAGSKPELAEIFDCKTSELTESCVQEELNTAIICFHEIVKSNPTLTKWIREVFES